MDIPRPTQPPPAITLLDGATATNLFTAGMPQGICIEKWILENSENSDCLINLQCEYINAGSNIIYAPTFSANSVKLSHFTGSRGFTDEIDVADINEKLVSLSKKAREKSGKKDVLIAGDLSPTGEFLMPFGELSFDEMFNIYQEQAQALNDAGVDLFVVETMVSISEARAAVLACLQYNKPVYCTVTINEHGKMLTGASPLTALVTLQELGISAFGLNCCGLIDMISDCIATLVPFSHIPLIAKPNAGFPNPLLPNVYELSPVAMQESMKKILDAGAEIIGGCCGTTPKHIKAIFDMISSYEKPVDNDFRQQQENDFLLTSETEFFALDNDRMEFSEPVYCSLDMADDLLDACNDSVDVLLIIIYSIDDAEQFSQNAHFAKLPVCFMSDSAVALERALKLYHGRAMVDARSPIQEDELKRLAHKYGAVID